MAGFFLDSPRTDLHIKFTTRIRSSVHM